MDFLYLSFALLLSVTLCAGQTEETPAQVPTFEVKIYPELTKSQISVGEKKLLTCLVSAVEGSDPPAKDGLTYEWSKDGVPITNEDTSTSPYVQLKSSGYVLRMDKVTENDAGSYTCTVTAADGQSAVKNILLEITQPLVVEAEPEQFGIKGQDGEIICKATSQPPPEVSWKDPNGVEISPESGKYVLEQDKLTIKDLEFSDAGEYVCEASVLVTGDLVSSAIEFDVVEVPTIQAALGTDPENAKIGDEVKITCKAEGIPAPEYSFKRGETLMPSTQVDSAQGILTLTEVKREDEADYTCIATNKGGFAEKTTTLDVLIPPEVEDIPDVPEAVEGSETSVICKATGDPEPGIAWRKVGMEVDYNEGTQVGGPTIEKTAQSPGDAEIKEVELKMTFNPIKAEHAGEYECTAFSTVGKATKKVTIEVQYKPIFKPVNEDLFYGWKGHRANLTCQVDANPAASILWKQANADDPTKTEEIPNADKYTITDLRQEGHISTRSLLIMITDDDDSVYKDYICEATNVQDVVVKSLTLTQATAPAAPLVKLGPILSTVATIFFEKPAETGGKPVQSFVYKYMEEGGNPSEAVTVDASESDGQTKVELSDLKPSTRYVITVQAKSLVGAGAEQSVTFDTQAVSPPLRLILESPDYGTEASTYKIQWKTPNDGGADITSFVIRYRQVEVTGNSPNQWTIVNKIDADFKTLTVTDGNALSANIEGLEKDSFYELNVVAVNSEGESDVARRIIKTSLGEGGNAEEGGDDNGNNNGDEEDGGENEANKGGAGAPGSSKDGSASAGMDSGLIIGIIVGIIVLLIIIVLVVIIVAKRRPRIVGKLRGKGGDEERGKADDGKEAAEEEKLIQKDDKVKVENETEDAKKDAVVEEKPQEFEPETKPEAPAEAPADKPADVPSVEVTSDTTVTPPENATA